MKNLLITSGRKFLLGIFLLTFSIVAFTGCDTDNNPEPELSALSSSKSVKAVKKTFVAPMDGSQEVVTGVNPPVITKATGNAVFQLREDGLHYKLIVANIQNVFMAHIHLAPAGANGAPVVWLLPTIPAPPAQIPTISGKSNGILVSGVITSANLVGALTGKTLDDLLKAMMEGGTYVNVHTRQYPGGEIRGQIK